MIESTPGDNLLSMARKKKLWYATCRRMPVNSIFIINKAGSLISSENTARLNMSAHMKDKTKSVPMARTARNDHTDAS
jgi:hypothetical protein